ncbi:MAG: 2,3-bisphosphoglycerate-independent phosphoglycerate mutase [Fidelibacterota bacterium]
MKKFILIILDGYGIREESDANAVKLAKTPNLDCLKSTCPNVQLETSGSAVGLPDGVMGNSEVGHTNIGAGRIVKQDLVRINDALTANQFQSNTALLQLFKQIKSQRSTLHLMGLISDAGVHSHISHLKELIRCAKKENVPETVVHCITDGRDTAPDSGIRYINNLESYLSEINYGRIVSVIGRYYAMDRDNRWDRIQLAYEMLNKCTGELFATAKEAILSSYSKGFSDEFILPKIIGKGSKVKEGDGVLMFNYRADRMRQISKVFTDPEFSEFPVTSQSVHYVSMTQYQENFSFPVLFKPLTLTNIFPEVLSRNGYRQLRIAETEKYAHVTYFFNGGDETIFDGEDRILVPSPKVSTYDLQPEMSAYEVTNKVVRAIQSDRYEAIILNFANPDMVGHTGNLPAAITAMETVDKCIGKIIEAITQVKGTIFLTADHGNLELMVDPETGGIHTSHTTLPVPFIMCDPSNKYDLNGNGKLADIAPTILEFIDLEVPEEINGISLLRKI